MSSKKQPENARMIAVGDFTIDSYDCSDTVKITGINTPPPERFYVLVYDNVSLPDPIPYCPPDLASEHEGPFSVGTPAILTGVAKAPNIGGQQHVVVWGLTSVTKVLNETCGSSSSSSSLSSSSSSSSPSSSSSSSTSSSSSSNMSSSSTSSSSRSSSSSG